MTIKRLLSPGFQVDQTRDSSKMWLPQSSGSAVEEWMMAMIVQSLVAWE